MRERWEDGLEYDNGRERVSVCVCFMFCCCWLVVTQSDSNNKTHTIPGGSDAAKALAMSSMGVSSVTTTGEGAASR